MKFNSSTSHLWGAVSAIFNNPSVINLNSTAKIVYIFIAFRQGNNSHSYYKMEEISRQCGVKSTQLRIALKTLIDLNLIKKSVRRGKSLSWQYVYSIGSESVQDHRETDEYSTIPIDGKPLNGNIPINGKPLNAQTDSLYIKNNNKKIKIKKTFVDKISTPDFVPKESWENYLAYRKEKDKKMLSLQAQKIAIGKLTKFHAEGYDIASIIEESILRNWSGLFPVKKYTDFSSPAQKPRLNERAQQLRNYLDSLKMDMGGQSLNFFPN